MSACAQCGTVAKPSDKFCNVCGTPIAAGPPGAGPAGPGGYGAPQQGYAPPPAQGGFGPPPAFGGGQGYAPPPGPMPSPPRCAMGHEISPGASYCAQGHPIAIDQMQFGSDAYGGAPPQQQGFGGPPPPPAFGAPPPAGPYGAPPPAPPGFGGPPGPPPGQGFQPPQQGFGGPPGPGFGPPPAQPGFPPPGGPGGFGGAPGYAPPGAPAPAPGAGFSPEAAPPARILRGFMIAYGANPSGDFWPLTGGRLIVGRLAAADGVDISLQDLTISSRHAAVVVDAATGGIAIEDTGSTNGTFVNDEHVGFNGRRDLRDGDRLRFGGFTTVIKIIGRV